MSIRRTARFDSDPMMVGEAFPFIPPVEFRSRNGVLTNGRLLGLIDELGEEDFLVSESHYRGVGLSDVEGVYFIEDRELSYGREESAHGVIFGQLMIESHAGGEAPELVAIKPFDTPQEAVHEFGVMTRINSMRGPARHRQLTFQPIGFCALADNAVGVVSEYEHDVQSFDNLFWNEEKLPSTPQVHQALKQAGFILGALHHLGFSQGDSQIKNIARGNQGPRIIDVESCRTFTTTTDGRDETVQESTTQDLRVLTDSLYLPNEYPDGRYNEAIVEALIPNYLRTVHLPTSRVPKSATYSIDQLRQVLNI